MKKIFAICAVLLSGCSLLGPVHQFDNVEYNHAVASAVASTRAVHQCYDQGPLYQAFVQDLNATTLQLAEYEKYRPASVESLASVNEIRGLVLDLQKRASPTLRYCQHKLSEIQSASRVVAQALGNQQKLSMCISDVELRYNVYLDSLQAGMITREEFDELVADIQQLALVDIASCTMEMRAKIQKSLETISKAASIAASL